MTASSNRLRLRPLVLSLGVNVGLPLLAVQWLLHAGVSVIVALSLSAVFPLADTLVTIVRSRRVSPLGALSLMSIGLGLATSAISGNPVFALAKESVFTGVFGLVFLGSLATARPLIFGLGRTSSTGGDAAGMAEWDARWDRQPAFRRVLRIMTLVWGLGLLGEAVARVAVALTLPVTLATIVSPALQVVAFGGLILWTAVYARVMRRRAERREAREGVAAGANAA